MKEYESLASAIWDFNAAAEDELHLVAGQKACYLPKTPLSLYHDAAFSKRFSVRFPYMAGAMANRIASPDLVVAMAKSGCLGSYGAAGLSLRQIEKDLSDIEESLADLPFAVNLIHTPGDEAWEMGLVELLERHSVNLIEASAFMRLSLALVRYRVRGIHCDQEGYVRAPNKVIAKISRPELAEKFMSPPPESLLQICVEKDWITPLQAKMAASIPVADTVTVEADSGGHTDNRPALVLWPIIDRVRAHLQALHAYDEPILLGLAGGIASPMAAESAFALGADYIVTGSVNQACRESGTSLAVKSMLASAGVADIAMAPAADMFEMGIKVQVLKKATMFPMRAQKLFEIYRSYSSLSAIPADVKKQLESQIFRASLEHVWSETRQFFLDRGEESTLKRADQDEKVRMGLVFRSYLGRASQWANQGIKDRSIDYQVWCGPAMGAFNDWSKGSFLETPEAREVSNVALNFLLGGLAMRRINILRAQGYAISSPEIESLLRPKTDEELSSYMSEV